VQLLHEWCECYILNHVHMLAMPIEIAGIAPMVVPAVHPYNIKIVQMTAITGECAILYIQFSPNDFVAIGCLRDAIETKPTCIYA
jgi:hypothetical protein